MNEKALTNEIKIIRAYDAPLKSVWEAWTDPIQTAKWWGPRGFTLTTHSKELKSGGTWIYTMHGPDGTNYPNKTFYHKVEMYSSLVYDHGASDTSPPLFKVNVNFSEENKKTIMNLRMILPTPEAAAEIKKFIKQAGGDATWDRLAEYLAETVKSKKQFVINRTFNVGLDEMFEMWTHPGYLTKWLAPKGFEMGFIKNNIKEGGSTLYFMTNNKDVKMFGKAHYLEIKKPNLIRYTQQFCDEHERISRHPHAPTWPETMHTLVELTAEGRDETRVTITWDIYGQATQEEVDTFVNSRPGMTLGWTGSFDKLEECLLNRKSVK